MEIRPKAVTGGLDVTVPVSARIWSYWGGGKDYFQVDKAAGDEFAALYPGIRPMARASRLFLGRAVSYLAGEAGVRQFLDIGAGLPSTQNTHEVAQRAAPDSRVVYVDNDPLVMSHARALLRGVSKDTTGYIEGDLRDPAMILAVAREKLDFTRPVAIMLMGIIGHIGNPAERDDDYALSLVDCLKEALPAGGYLVLRDATDTEPDHVAALRRYAATGAVPYRLRSPEQITRFFDGLEPVEPGVVPVQRWRPDASSAELPEDINMWGAVARKLAVLPQALAPNGAAPGGGGLWADGRAAGSAPVRPAPRWFFSWPGTLVRTSSLARSSRALTSSRRFEHGCPAFLPAAKSAERAKGRIWPIDNQLARWSVTSQFL